MLYEVLLLLRDLALGRCCTCNEIKMFYLKTIVVQPLIISET